MASKTEDFSISGPLELTAINWRNEDHQRSVAACLVQGVYVLERDRQKHRQGYQALAPRWWTFFHFELLLYLEDDTDSSIFGAIYEFKPPPSHYVLSTDGIPRFVIAFRGTLRQPRSVLQDFKLDWNIFLNKLHQSSRFEIAMSAVRDMVACEGNSNVWLAGHSLGASIAMLVGKTMAKTGVFLEAFLFNPPFISVPIEKIKDEKVKHGIRMAKSVITAVLAVANNSGSQDPFLALSEWLPRLFVNQKDPLCSAYVGYFARRKEAGGIERFAMRYSLRDLFKNLRGKGSDSDPLHLIPSAKLTVDLSHPEEAHGIHWWWKPDLTLPSQVHKYQY